MEVEIKSVTPGVLKEWLNAWACVQVKFVFFEKATKFDEISILLLTSTSSSVFRAQLLKFCQVKTTMFISAERHFSKFDSLCYTLLCNWICVGKTGQFRSWMGTSCDLIFANKSWTANKELKKLACYHKKNKNRNSYFLKTEEVFLKEIQNVHPKYWSKVKWRFHKSNVVKLYFTNFNLNHYLGNLL